MISKEQDSGLLNIKQAAELLNVSEVSLRRWTRSGELACLRVGPRQERRFRQEDLQAYLRQRAAPARVINDREIGGSRIDLEGISIEHGSHMCTLYKSDLGRVKLAVPFLSEGLSGGDLCFLIAADDSKDHILARLKAVQPKVDDKIADGTLVVSTGADSGAAMYDFFENAFVEGTRSGGCALRVLGDMAWALERGIGVDELMDFELRYNQFLAHQFPVVSLCQYDVRRFSGVAVLDALKCHDDTFKYPLGRFLN